MAQPRSPAASTLGASLGDSPSTAPPLMADGLFALLRFLRGEFERSLEHADLHLEGVDELDAEGRELALEVGQALLEALEFTRGYLLDAFSALGDLRTECALLPTVGGVRTVAALALRPADLALPLLGLEPGEEVFFDGIYAYRQAPNGDRALWAEIADRPLPPANPGAGKLPVLR